MHSYNLVTKEEFTWREETEETIDQITCLDDRLITCAPSDGSLFISDISCSTPKMIKKLSFKVKRFCVVESNNQKKLLVAKEREAGVVLIKTLDLKSLEDLDSFEVEAGKDIRAMGSTTDGVVYFTDLDCNLHVCKMGVEGSQKTIKREGEIYYGSVTVFKEQAYVTRLNNGK